MTIIIKIYNNCVYSACRIIKGKSGRNRIRGCSIDPEAGGLVHHTKREERLVNITRIEWKARGIAASVSGASRVLYYIFLILRFACLPKQEETLRQITLSNKKVSLLQNPFYFAVLFSIFAPTIFLFRHFFGTR